MATIHKPLGLFLFFIALVLFTSGEVAALFYHAEIEDNLNGEQGSTVSVPVYCGTNYALYGFDLLIVYDTAALTFAGTNPGELFDIPGSYEWEYFESRVDTTGPQPGLIRAVGLAETNDGHHHPVSVLLPEYGITLFTLEFTVTTDPAFEFTESPLRFYWVDCGDNAIVPDSLGDTLALSYNVFDWIVYDHDITDHSYGLPGIHGAPDSCLFDTTIIRAINYFNGGITILPPGGLNNRGDINCNGIAYEIADYVQYAYYFIVGLSAFGEHLVCSMAASDINFDMYELTVADFVYLYRVIIGDAQPYPGAAKSDTVFATFTQDDDAKTVSFDYPDSLAGIHLIFDGEIIPTLLFSVEGILMDYGFNEGLTRVVIYPEISAPSPAFTTTDGPFLSYTGSALLIEVDAADYSGTVFNLSIENYGSELTIPFGFEIGIVQDAVQGEEISIPIIRTAGSERMSGFDFLMGYDNSALSINSATPGSPFDIPGDYEWESFTYRFGQLHCGEGSPSGSIRIVGVAEIPNGAHHPNDIPIENGTVLFNINVQVAPDPEFEGMFVPVSFFWCLCGDNGVALGEYGETLALSDHVYDHNGVEITDTAFGFPGYYGALDLCFEQGPNPPIRFVNFTSGGVDIVDIESMELILSIDDTTAYPGDSAIYLDVHMSNPQDSVAGFVLYIQMDNPDLVEFGISPLDTFAIDIENTLMSDWDVVSTQSITGQYHDLKIVAISNSTPPYTSAIAPQQNGVLVRLVLHAYDGVPVLVTDSTQLIINDIVSNTNFSDPGGQLIGFSEGEYNPQTVSFQHGFITILGVDCGDANSDRQVNVADAVFLIAYIFSGGFPPDPECAADANGDGDINIGDAVYLIAYVFSGGQPPVEGCCQ
jgi:hypothetical protein